MGSPQRGQCGLPAAAPVWRMCGARSASGPQWLACWSATGAASSGAGRAASLSRQSPPPPRHAPGNRHPHSSWPATEL
eukprot:1145792-Pelagomonas_calceolata.AAC.5